MPDIPQAVVLEKAERAMFPFEKHRPLLKGLRSEERRRVSFYSSSSRRPRRLGARLHSGHGETAASVVAAGF